MNSEIARIIARILAGSWRVDPPPLELSELELVAVAPRLLETGAGALSWWRLRGSSLSGSTSGCELRDAYRLHAVQALAHEDELRQILSLFYRQGIEPILVKGWSIARLYPEIGLRPYGDVDLCVRSDEFERAKRLVANLDVISHPVDIHCEFEVFHNESWAELESRSEIANVVDVPVRVLGAEDHLRLLCFHFLREGAWRPLWLCDIAAAIENHPASFDWELLLRRNRTETDWLLCTLLLAHDLLDANLKGTLPVIISESLPKWLMPCVLHEWNSPTMPLRHRLPIFNLRMGLGNNLRGLRARWPNPVEATVGVGAPFNELPRLPFQLAQCFLRATKYFSSFSVRHV